MEVFRVQQILVLLFDPEFLRECLAFRAMTITTGIVRNFLKAAVAADINMGAECGGPAIENRTKRFALNWSEGVAIQIFRSELAEDVLNFNHAAHTGDQQDLQFRP